MKTIVIRIQDNDEVDIEIDGDGELTDKEKLLLGDALFDEQDVDNEGQVIFYSGIQDPDIAGTG